MIIYKEIEIKMQTFRKIAIYPIWNDPEICLFGAIDLNYKVSKWPNHFKAKQPEMFVKLWFISTLWEQFNCNQNRFDFMI